jgi:acetyl-CoA acyltransferase
MTEAVIVEAVRSPVEKRKGGLSGVHPADLSVPGIRYGLQTMCEGGGQASATILDLL